MWVYTNEASITIAYIISMSRYNQHLSWFATGDLHCGFTVEDRMSKASI